MNWRRWVFLAVGAGVLIVVLAAAVAWTWDTHAGELAEFAPNNQPPSAELIKRGEYLAKQGDCGACHSLPGAAPFSGGLKMGLPIGAIYTSNITPDKTYGIGNYTFADFDRAVRWGVAEGHSLYPAMPYPSYSILKREDMVALYAYFLAGVAPAAVANREAAIVFPLSLRFPLAYWRKAFAPIPKPFDPAEYPDPIVAQGAYFVRGLGHCGECHTPRGPALEVEAQNEHDGSRFLQGSPVENWYAPSLRSGGNDTLGSWGENDIVQFLTTGANHVGITFGSMNDVITNSSQYLAQEDAIAAARYLKSLRDSPASGATHYAYDEATEQALANGQANQPGALLYLNNCAACHRPDGKGYEGVFPRLAGNPVVETENPMSLISIILLGSKTSRTAATPARFAMPVFAWRLSDQEVSEVTTFIRSSWGNKAPPVEVKRVAALRSSTRLTIPPSQ